MTVRAVVAAGTDIGHVREGNEDSFLAEEPLFAVADGMGGHRGGEVASSLALETIERMFALGEGELVEQVREANRAVFERSTLDRAVAGMGTTLTAALLEGDHIRLAHVGDSRAYLVRDGRLRLLTEDHTLVHRMVLEGELTEAEAEVHPHRSILTRALGVDPDVEVDEITLEVRAGDRLLLCSDGLTGMLPEPRVEEILGAEVEPQRAVDRLIREANDAGGVDNITAIVIALTETDTDPSEGDTSATTATPGDPGPPSVTTGTVSRGGRAERISGSAEQEPPRPTPRPLASSRRPKPPWPKLATWVGVTLGILVLAFVGLRLYLDSQWFVGVSDGRVAVYRGIPAQVAGFDLNHVVVETSIPADAATSFALYRDLPDGITADDREEAQQIVEQIRRDTAIGQQDAGAGGGA